MGMDNKTKKIIGWVLLAVGLIIIFSDLYSSFNIFTARTLPPAVFKNTAIDDSSQAVSGQLDLQKIMADQMSKLIPKDSIFKIMNLVSWSIFAWVLVLIGGKICSIGTGLLKDKQA